MRYDEGGDLYQPGASPSPTPTPTTTGTATAPTYTAPPPPPASTLTLSAGTTPDYAGLLQSDSGYLAAKSAADLAQANAAAQRKAALRQAIIRYGGLPSGFTDQYGDVDQATQDAAAQNQNSVLAQLADNYTKGEDQFRRGLAARGALQSGDLNYGEDQLNRAYGQQRYDAANAAGSEANSALNAYGGVLSNNAQSLSSAIAGAESNVYSNPAYRPTPAVTANYDAANSTTYGQPVYVDDSGNLYDQNGNPFSPPAASPAYSPPNLTPDQNGIPMAAGFYGFDQYGNWIG